MTHPRKVWLSHFAVLVALAALWRVLPEWHGTNLARILVLAVYAMGYNLAFGYAGLLSLGHALFFALGMYGAGLPVHLLEWGTVPAFVTGTLAGGIGAGLVGLLALRTRGVSFMIVTLMFAQAGFLTVIYFNTFTGGDQGFVVEDFARTVGPWVFSQPGPRFWAAWSLFAVALAVSLLVVRSRFGRVMLGLRENEERSRMLGFDPFAQKLRVMVLSGLFAGAAGAAQALLFAYVGSSFATIQYSILPLLYTLLGGAGTVLGPLIGAGLMFYLVDLASDLTQAYLAIVGVVLIVVVLFAPRGLLGWLRERGLPWLP